MVPRPTVVTKLIGRFSTLLARPSSGHRLTVPSRSGSVKDPLDAAQVPPSVFAQHTGGIDIAHNDLEHDRQGRHEPKMRDRLNEYGSGRQ